jgi:hypothetical protein
VLLLLTALTVIVPEQEALWPLQFPELTDTVTLLVFAVILLLIFGVQVRPLVTSVLPHVTFGRTGFVPVVMV